MSLFRFLLPALVLSLFGCSSEPDSANLDGKELYNYYCAACHKESGEGSFLKGVPANNQTQLSESQIAQLILQGHPELPDMPTFSHLSQDQAKAIAAYLRKQL